MAAQEMLPLCKEGDARWPSLLGEGRRRVGSGVQWVKDAGAHGRDVEQLQCHHPPALG